MLSFLHHLLIYSGLVACARVCARAFGSPQNKSSLSLSGLYVIFSSLLISLTPLAQPVQFYAFVLVI